VRAVLGAIMTRDGSPVALADVQALADRARLPWAEKPRLILGDGFGLVWVPACTREQPTSPDGLAPWSREPRRHEVVVDGTLDDRSELARRLGLPTGSDGPGSEPCLIAAAYERWGPAFLPSLVGELAFLLWDRTERRLLAYRDTFGLRELFYCESSRQFLVASQLQMLLDRPALSDLNEEYVAEFLSVQFFCGPMTPFRGAVRLQAGHQLTITGAHLATRRYWDFEDRPLRQGTSEEHAERFLSLFQEGIEACCKSTTGRVWAELSGGLDSSSIVCLAQEILKREPAQGADFATLTFVWDDTPQSDERRWSDPVVQKYGLVNHRLRGDDLFFDGVHEASLYRNEPHFGLLCHPMIKLEADLLHGVGVEVLLSGSRAESVVLADLTPPVHLADHLRGLRLRCFYRELLRWQRGTHQPLANLLLRFALQPLLWPHRSVGSSEDAPALSPWLDQSFVRRTKLLNRVREARAARRFRNAAQQFQYERLCRSEQMVHRGFSEWSCEVRYPFLYRPLVEFVLAVPWEAKVSPEEGKLLLRRSLEGRLPELVRTRQGGGGPGPSMYKAYARRWAWIEPVVRSSLLVSMGFLDRAEFTRAAELVSFGMSRGYGAFLSCLALELWLRAVTGWQEPCRG